MDALRRQIHAIEEVAVHEVSKAAGMPGADADELVEVECRRPRQVDRAAFDSRRKILVEEHRCPASGQAEDERRRGREGRGHPVGQSARERAFIRKDRNAWRS